MTLHELKSLLAAHPEKQFRLQLPDATEIPISFHITEVGQINKTFIDCGGKVHSTQTCQLQVWLGPDKDHRLDTTKLLSILELAHEIIPNENIEVEFEYENVLISQFPVAEYSKSEEALTLHLTTKHTDCLAPELCVIPPIGISCCAPSSGCC